MFREPLRLHCRIRKNNDPCFFNGPFDGVIAGPTAWSFIYFFMPNKSEEYPESQLHGEVLKFLYSITGKDGTSSPVLRKHICASSSEPSPSSAVPTIKVNSGYRSRTFIH